MLRCHGRIIGRVFIAKAELAGHFDFGAADKRRSRRDHIEKITLRRFRQCFDRSRVEIPVSRARRID